MKSLSTWILALGLLLQFRAAFGQKYLDMIQDSSAHSFDEIDAEARQYFSQHSRGKGSGYKQYQRWRWFNGPRSKGSPIKGNPSLLNWEHYLEYKNRAPVSTQKTDGLEDNGNWELVGSTSYTNTTSGHSGGMGRIDVIKVHPSNSNIVYAGTNASGLWKTTNNGASWTCLTDDLGCMGVAGIEMNSVNHNHLYILTGDREGFTSRSTGVLESTNGGETWFDSGLRFRAYDQYFGKKLDRKPDASKRMYALTNQGLFEKPDENSPWLSSRTFSGDCIDLEFKPSDPDVKYLSTRRAVFRQSNDGGTWNQVLSDNAALRIELAVSPDEEDFVYALAANDTGYVCLYRSTDGGQSWNIRWTAGKNDPNNPNILGYNLDGTDTLANSRSVLSLVANPNDAYEIFVGGVNIWRSHNGGRRWEIQSHWLNDNGQVPYVHADIRNLIWRGSQRVYACTDGGIVYSDNSGASWTDISSGLNISQFYKFGVSPQLSRTYLAGGQDIGSNILSGPSLPIATMSHLRSGDGMESIIDYSNPSILYIGSQFGSISRSTTGGTSWTRITDSITGGNPRRDSVFWLSPFVMHPTNSRTLLAGYTSLWRTNDRGNTWQDIGNGQLGPGDIVDIEFSPFDANTLFVLKRDSVYRSDNNGASWQNITGNLPSFVSFTDLEPSQDNPSRLYVTMSGFSPDHKVYTTTGGGYNWSDLESRQLPDIPINCIIYDKQANFSGTYVGTDCGVFYFSEYTRSWVPFSEGLPNTIITELEINPTSNKLIASTFGRGLWETYRYGAFCVDNLQLNGYYFNSQTFEANISVQSSGQVYNGATVNFYALDKISLQPGFKVYGNGHFKAQIQGCSSAKNPLHDQGRYVEAVPEAPEAHIQDLLTEQSLLIYPNPSQGNTRLSFELQSEATVSLNVYDETLRRVKTFIQTKDLPGGIHHFDLSGENYPQGIYLIELTVNQQRIVKKLALIR